MQERVRSRWNRLVLLALLITIIGSAGTYGKSSLKEEDPETKSTKDSATSSDNQQPSSQTTQKISYPGFHNLRYMENWKVLKDSPRDTVFEKIKFVPLNADGSFFFTFGGQIRLRGEGWWDFGFGGEGNRNDTFGLSRVRLHGDFRFGKHVRAFVEGKSSLATDRNLPGGLRGLDVDTLDLQNALIDINASFEPVGLTFRLGRQELQYGKQRLVSPLDWANTRRTFDGAKGIVSYEKLKIDGFWSRYAPVKKYSFNTSHDSGVQLFGLYASVNATATYSLDFYWFGLEKDSASFHDITAPESRHTFGVRMGGKIKDSIDLDLEAAFQVGSHGNRDVRAAMFGGQVGYLFESGSMKPKIYTGLEFGSGDSNPEDDQLGTFNQMFPLAHAFLGYVDMVGRQNIVGWNSGFSFVPFNKFTVKSDALAFWRHRKNDALYNAGGGIVRPGDSGDSKYVGFELDFTVRRPVNRHFIVIAGYSHFFPGAFLKESGPSGGIDFTYFTLQFTF